MRSLVTIFFCVSFPLCAAEFIVKSVEELNSLKLSPGDEVVWANGSYAEDDRINFSAKGNALQGITLRAETPGGVHFTGGMTMKNSGDYSTVDGYHWKGGEGQNNHIQFRKGSVYANHSTLRNCAIDNLTANGNDKHAPPPVIIVPDIKIELDPGPGHVTFTPDTKTNGHSGQNGSNNNGHGHYGDDR